MKTRQVLGRRIVAVNQERINTGVVGFVWMVRSITLDNGVKLIMHATETSDLGVVEITALKAYPWTPTPKP